MNTKLRIFNRGGFCFEYEYICSVTGDVWEESKSHRWLLVYSVCIIGAVSQGAAAKQEAETGRIEMKNDEINAYIERKW